jgi:hypothetical protein
VEKRKHRQILRKDRDAPDRLLIGPGLFLSLGLGFEKEFQDESR